MMIRCLSRGLARGIPRLSSSSSSACSATSLSGTRWAKLAGIPSRTLVSQPTLGPGSQVKITNPIKSSNGKDILRINVTERAAEKLKEINAADQKPDQFLRIQVESGGCHGFQYIFSLKDGTQEIDPKVDCIFERDGAKVVIDATSLEILRDSSVDYATELIGSQFKVVDSPYATSSCGCGSSFSIDPSSMPSN